MRIKYLLFLLPFVLLFSCVDGSYDPEGRWRINSQEPDECEENDRFEEAHEPESDLDLLYLNFYDDLLDYFIYHFDDRYTYTIQTDVPFDHTTDTTIFVYDIDKTEVKVSTESDDDERNAEITDFAPTADRYYILVMNTLSSGTGELRGYTLTINRNEE